MPSIHRETYRPLEQLVAVPGTKVRYSDTALGGKSPGYAKLAAPLARKVLRH